MGFANAVLCLPLVAMPVTCWATVTETMIAEAIFGKILFECAGHQVAPAAARMMVGRQKQSMHQGVL